jgi:hypothetical protein
LVKYAAREFAAQLYTGGLVFFFWGSNGSMISHYESLTSLE